MYNVTFTWGEFDAITRSMKGDRLGGRYASPEKSIIQWGIPETEKMNIELINLQKK